MFFRKDRPKPISKHIDNLFISWYMQYLILTIPNHFLQFFVAIDNLLLYFHCLVFTILKLKINYPQVGLDLLVFVIYVVSKGNNFRVEVVE